MSAGLRLSTLGTRVLQCRSMGHAWDHVDDHDHMTAASTKEIVRFWREERCLRCGAERTREIDLSRPNAVTVRTVGMHYPQGYLVHGARKRVTRGDALGAQYGRETWL
ncbi:MAG TPA: hypothetical protein VK065_06615 [Brevibacterium sp.]|nr:hypothetical protein [Brevibacterium sp.]